MGFYGDFLVLHSPPWESQGVDALVNLAVPISTSESRVSHFNPWLVIMVSIQSLAGGI